MDNRKNSDFWTCVGKITGASGTKGLLTIKSFCVNPFDIEKYNPLKVEGKIDSANIKIIRHNDKKFLVSLSTIQSRDQAEVLKGSLLLACKNKLPPTQKDEYYFAELIGTKVYKKHGELTGIVENVAEYGAGPFLEIRLFDSNETQLVPFNSSFVPKVCIEKNYIAVDFSTYSFSDKSKA